ncbi:MAG: polysaccharide biosynthesis/export family protein [Acidobacteria bacterium]|nr:polysaccharide biosynthesis/export family protein [Acidobacteriota bacterium]
MQQHRKRWLGCAACLLLTAGTLHAQGGGAQPYILSAGDSVEVRFSFNTDMNDRITIRPDGFISMAMIGEIKAAGKSPAQLSGDITAAYHPYLRDPQAVVVVREFANRRVYVTGEVASPGVLPITGPLTVLQAVANCGGARASAALDSAVLLRYEGGNKAAVQSVKLKEIMKGKSVDFLLQPFDVVFLPRSKIASLDLFVDQYVNSLVPRSLLFPYNINNVYTVTTK